MRHGSQDMGFPFRRSLSGPAENVKKPSGVVDDSLARSASSIVELCFCRAYIVEVDITLADMQPEMVQWVYRWLRDRETGPRIQPRVNASRKLR
jgi:hypothetical protein